MSVTDIRHKEIKRITDMIIPILEFEEVELCAEALGVLTAMLSQSVLEEWGIESCEEFKSLAVSIVWKHLDNI